MDKSYEPQTFETRWYAHWEANGCFKPSGKGQPYTIMLPPPNVTGTLHMGHAFQHTLMDALIRYHRMRGFDTLWQVGTDHAGIATEMVVSRNLARENLTRDGLGRESLHRAASGSGSRNPATPSRGRCAGSAPRATGRASASRWTRACPRPWSKPSCACTRRA